jgi:hypothetical protein
LHVVHRGSGGDIVCLTGGGGRGRLFGFGWFKRIQDRLDSIADLILPFLLVTSPELVDERALWRRLLGGLFGGFLCLCLLGSGWGLAGSRLLGWYLLSLCRAADGTKVVEKKVEEVFVLVLHGLSRGLRLGLGLRGRGEQGVGSGSRHHGSARMGSHALGSRGSEGAARKLGLCGRRPLDKAEGRNL